MSFLEIKPEELRKPVGYLPPKVRERLLRAPAPLPAPVVEPPPPPKVPLPIATIAPARRIMWIVAEEFGVSAASLISPIRSNKFVIPRHLAMYLVRKNTRYSYPEIGRHFGGRDHSTVINGVLQTECRLATLPEFASRVETIKAKLMGAKPA